jgi:ABC-type multidrug transport system fused ATPase/permease subunit
MITYGIDFTVLIVNNLEIQSPYSTAETIYTGGSLLLWIFFSSATKTSMHFIGLERQACWVIYGVAETVFMAGPLSVKTDNRCTTSTVSSMVRLGCLYTLCRLGLSPSIAELVTEQNKPPPDEGDLSTWDTLRYLFPFFWPAENVKLQMRFVGLIICVILQRWACAVMPVQQGRIIDHFNRSDEFSLLDIFHPVCRFIFWKFLSELNALVTPWMRLPLETWSKETVRSSALRQVMDQSAAFHDKKSPGVLWELVSRPSTVYEVFNTVFLRVVPSYIDFCVAAFVLLQLFGVQIAFVTAVSIAAYVSLCQTITRRETIAHRDSLSTSEVCRHASLEMIQCWSIIASFNRIADEMDRFAQIQQKEIRGQIDAEFWRSLRLFVGKAVLRIGLFSALLLTVYQVYLGKLPPGRVITLLGCWEQVTSPLVDITATSQLVKTTVFNTKRTVRLLRTKPTVTDCPGALPLEVKDGRVDFQSVSFGYDERQPVLQDISLTCEPGRTIALVGKTGHGKSTILRLLRRLYDCSGLIKIDGQDIQKVTLESLRSAIACVSQHPEMLNRTIMENLRYGNPEASEDDVYKVCMDVQIHEELSRIGYDEIIGEDGVKLSGGQLQRIAIARALLKGSRIILLDEASSAIDTVTEGKIQGKLIHRLKGCTVFVVAHRLPTIKHADKIFVIHDGKLVQQGTHEQLKECGLYGEMWAAQKDSTTDESVCVETERGSGEKRAST